MMITSHSKGFIMFTDWYQRKGIIVYQLAQLSPEVFCDPIINETFDTRVTYKPWLSSKV